MNGFICARCGAENQQNTNFCTNCGAPRPPAPAPTQPVQAPPVQPPQGWQPPKPAQPPVAPPRPVQPPQGWQNPVQPPHGAQPAKRSSALTYVLAALLLVVVAALVLVFIFHEDIFGSKEDPGASSISAQAEQPGSETPDPVTSVTEEAEEEATETEAETEAQEDEADPEEEEVLPPPYPSDAISYNGHHYYLFDCSHAADWEAAEAFCEEQGGYLAVISSRDEDRFLYNYMGQQRYENVYFGYSDVRSEGNWRWSSQERSSYTNWYPGEPNNYDSREHYAMYYLGYEDGTWNDDNGLIFDLDHAPFVWAERIYASSELTEGATVYSASNAIDGDPLTAWSEGAGGQGIGESLTMDLTKTYDLVGLTIHSGFQYSPDFYDVNSRPRVLELTFSDGTTEEVELEDHSGSQTVYFRRPVSASSVTIKIKSVYPGSKFEDTCISEISLISGILNTAFVCEWSE